MTLVLVSFAPRAVASEATKAEEVRQTLDVLLRIHQLASRPGTPAGSAMRRDVGSLVGRTHSPYELALLAIMAYDVEFPGNAENANYDNYFDTALWICIERLSKTPGPEAAKGLKTIGLRIVFDGESHSFEGFVAAQRRLTEAGP